MSAFVGKIASIEQIKVSIRQLSTAFPQMSPEFWELLAKRIINNHITASRLEYAIGRVIDNYTYQRLTIADIIGEGSDKKFRMLSYNKMLAEMAKSGSSMADYAPIKIQGCDKPAWVLKTDKQMYNIPDEL